MLLPEQAALFGRARRYGQAEVGVGAGAGHAAARGALDEALLEQIGLDNVLDRVAGLGDGGGEGVHADRAAAVVLDQGLEEAAVVGVEAGLVDLEPGQGAGGGEAVDGGGAREIASRSRGTPRVAGRLLLETDPLKAEFDAMLRDVCPGFLTRAPAPAGARR